MTVTSSTIVVAVKVGGCTELSSARKITNTTRDGAPGVSSFGMISGLGIVNASFPRDGHVVNKRACKVIDLGAIWMVRDNASDVHVLRFITDVERKIYTGCAKYSTRCVSATDGLVLGSEEIEVDNKEISSLGAGSIDEKTVRLRTFEC